MTARTAVRAAIAYRWQYCRGDDDITSEPFCVTYADRLRAWEDAHGDLCIVEVVRTPRDRWRITTTDYPVVLPISAYDRRFPSPLDALAYVTNRMQRRPVEAVCRCGTPGVECD